MFLMSQDADYDPKAHISGEDEDEPAKEVRRMLSGKKRGESTKNANAEEVLVIVGQNFRAPLLSLNRPWVKERKRSRKCD